MTQPTLTQIHDEIINNPKGLAYSASVAIGNDTGVALILNSTYAGVGIVYRSELMPQEVLKSLVWSELSVKSSTHIQILQLLLAPRMVDAGQQTIRDIFVGLFPSGSTIANLDAVAKVVGPTRAEELWGAGTIISSDSVAHALRG